MSRCECGCGKFAKPGNRFIVGHNQRTPGYRGSTHSNQSAREFVLFDCEKEIGNISDSRPYGFSNQQEVLAWWETHRIAFMKNACKEFLEEVKSHGDKSNTHDYVDAADRPQIFWGLEFGFFYPDQKERLLLLECHSLWYPSERALIIAEGRTIPESKYKRCLLHPCGHPIKWPDEPAVKLERGEWYRADCQTTKLIRGSK